MANSYADFMYDLKEKVIKAGSQSINYVHTDMEYLTIVSREDSRVYISLKVTEYSSTLLTALIVETKDETRTAQTTSEAIVHALTMLNELDERKSVEPTINDIKRSIEETEGVTN